MVTATAAAGVAANTATTTTGLDEKARIDHSPGPSEGSGAGCRWVRWRGRAGQRNVCRWWRDRVSL